MKFLWMISEAEARTLIHTLHMMSMSDDARSRVSADDWFAVGRLSGELLTAIEHPGAADGEQQRPGGCCMIEAPPLDQAQAWMCSCGRRWVTNGAGTKWERSPTQKNG